MNYQKKRIFISYSEEENKENDLELLKIDNFSERIIYINKEEGNKEITNQDINNKSNNDNYKDIIFHVIDELTINDDKNKQKIFEINEEVERRIVYNDDIEYFIELIINNEKE